MASQFSQTFMYNVLWYFNDIHADYWRLHLMRNNIGNWTLAYDSVWDGGLSLKEATFKGYAAVQLANVVLSWDAPNSRVLLTADDITFAYDSGEAGDASNTVDGWVLTYFDLASSEELFVCGDHFVPPYIFSADGHALPLKPNLVLYQAA